MSVPHASIFLRNSKKTLLCHFCVFIIVIEAACLKLCVHSSDKVLHNSFKMLLDTALRFLTSLHKVQDTPWNILPHGFDLCSTEK